MIDRFGNEEQRQRFLPKLTSMEWLASYCLTEPGSGSDAAALKTRAVRSGGNGSDYVLNGAKQFISGAGDSDSTSSWCAPATTARRASRPLVVESGRARPLLRRQREQDGLEGAADRARCIFDDCAVPARRTCSAARGRASAIAMAGLDGGRLNIAACSLGGAQSALDKALAYMASARRSARRSTEFQALQFKLADMETELQAARIFLLPGRRGSSTQGAGRDRNGLRHGQALRDRHRLRRRQRRAAAASAATAISPTTAIEKMVRDLRVHQILEGTNEIMRVIVARHRAVGQ
jgi:alkylation response protein AidB-like acyl-CoA dehydrogenase